MAKTLTEEGKVKIARFEGNLRKIYSMLKREDGTSDMTFQDFRKEFISLGDIGAGAQELERMKAAIQTKRDIDNTVCTLDLN